MSNPTVSFRISDYHLARGLRAIRSIDPTWELTTTSDLIRTIFIDYIAKFEHTNNCPLHIQPELLQEVAFARVAGKKIQADHFKPLGQPKQQQPTTIKPNWQVQRELEEERLFNEMRRESALAQQIKNARTNEQIDIIANTQQEVMPEVRSEIKPRIKPSEFHDPNITDSIINTVTDFSPPKDWIEQD